MLRYRYLSPVFFSLSIRDGTGSAPANIPVSEPTARELTRRSRCEASFCLSSAKLTTDSLTASSLVFYILKTPLCSYNELPGYNVLFMRNESTLQSASTLQKKPEYSNVKSKTTTDFAHNCNKLPPAQAQHSLILTKHSNSQFIMTTLDVSDKMVFIKRAFIRCFHEGPGVAAARGLGGLLAKYGM